MKLHEQMSDAVADVHLDTDRLTGAARTLGGRTRRRRRIGAIGGVAAVGILAFGIAVSVPGDEPAPSQGPFAEDPSDAPPVANNAGTVAIDGRNTTAALREAVLAVTDGETTGYLGQDATEGVQQTYGQLELTPASGGGAGVVGLNIQPASILDGVPFKCTKWMVDCTIRVLPGGDRLRTYTDGPVAQTDGSSGLRVVAEYFSTRRDLRVVASATNGFEQAGNEWDVTREDPVLSMDQLADVVTQDWWGFELPARFAEEGEQLTPYEDVPTRLYKDRTDLLEE